MGTFRIGAEVQERCPVGIADRSRIGWTRDGGFTGVAEFKFGARAAPGAVDQQHQCATAAAAASSIVAPAENRSSANGALIGCGSSRAMVQANRWPEPGVALNP